MRILQAILVLVSLSGTTAFAVGSGHGLQFSISLTTSTQNDLNSWVDSLGTAGTKNFTSGYEFMADYQYRFSSSMFAMKFRPSMYSNTASGGGVDMKLNGTTFFAMLRMYPLENSFMKFFLQTGVGIASMAGEITQGGSNVAFKGDSFGVLGGMGAEFCFTGNHCLVVEGNYRYLPIPRNTVTSSSGTVSNLSYGGNGSELEFNNNDVSTSLSGLQGVLAYGLSF